VPTSTIQGCINNVPNKNALVIYMGKLSTLLEWSEQDPPDDKERSRNDAVFSYQTNRNPFIDHPEWARCVFTNTNCPVQSDVIFQHGFE